MTEVLSYPRFGAQGQDIGAAVSIALAAEHPGLVAGIHLPGVVAFPPAGQPGAPPFVKAGDSVEVGQVLCIVEAMKLLNEIESDVAGEIVKKLATNGQPIEYGQELFVIRPKK